MRRCHKRTDSTERRQLAGQVKGVVIVTAVQVLLTVTLNAVVTAALSWAR